MADIELDSAGIVEVLNSGAVAAAVSERAEAIAGSVRSSTGSPDVVVDSYTTDRSAASVTIRDVRGRVWQARNGVLTRAASSAGLEVNAR